MPTRKRRDGIPSRGKPQRITLDQAVEFTQRYRRSAPASEHGGFFYSMGLVEVLSQPGCTGIRFYHGLDARGAYRLVIVGVDGDGNDMVGGRVKMGGDRGSRVRKRAPMAGGGEAVILDTHLPCPPFCPPDSPLV
ncbi:MAG: hypothetical protein ACT4OZ_12425 [Gemmatimonadota bacterium]